ncbi:pleckstrin (PH) domain-containing protein [Tieghemostelium lacteum]|uniref:Pleckstrin (PH) domain-containing protein n=1 Tax=Tieghemostelium lacteum TaxID=361077 RepID=A0A151ZAD3_TIELA|nr:pleckstrin (PH) domain-containing protein [Tieghemostelium lacteum]|eukprot:KYQ90912.1 pleckstrin (PH) domain-containing protein [Tieghemostelium lacteum]
MTSENEANIETIKQLSQLEENRYCADCGEPKPQWAASNIGVFLCITCAGIHRKLGTHISRIKSVTLDSWKACEIEVMKQTNNIKANKYWEHALPKNFIKPHYTDSIGYKEQWIISKYSSKSFVPEDNENNIAIDKRINFELREGWICKQGAIIKNWKKRWLKFIGDDSLAYYKNPTDITHCGIISLKEVEMGQIDSVDQVDSKPNCFMVSTPKRKFLISCNSGEDMLMWIQNIRLSVKLLNHNYNNTRV